MIPISIPSDRPFIAPMPTEANQPDQDTKSEESLEVAPYDVFIDGLQVDMDESEGEAKHEGAFAAAAAEEIPENEDNPYFAMELPDDEIDLADLLRKMNARTRQEKIMLLIVTVFAVVGPLNFITGLIQLPWLFEEYFTALSALISMTCRLPPEDLEGGAWDMVVTRVEGIRTTMTTAYVTIAAALVGVTYQAGKKCWKRRITNELVQVLQERNVENAHLIRNYEFSTVKMREVIQSIRTHGIQRELLESIHEEPSYFEQAALNTQYFRHECMRYFKFFVLVFSIPGLAIWWNRAESLSQKIDCDKSTVLWDSCTADKQYEHLALLVYPWLTSSMGAMGMLTLMLLIYFVVPRSVGRVFNERVNQPILRLFSLRDEDKESWRYHDFIWALVYSTSLIFLTMFSLTRAYKTTQEFAELSGCAGVFSQWMSVITGIDVSTDECPKSRATLIFGGGVANLEIDKFYPLYILAESFALALALVLLRCTPYRRLVSPEFIDRFLKRFNEIHQRSLNAGYLTVGLIGVPLFYRSINFALPILTTGITEKKHFDNVDVVNGDLRIKDGTLEEGLERICPYDKDNFLEQLKSSFSELLRSVIYKGNGDFEFIIARSCPEYASYAGALELYALTLSNQSIDCNPLSYNRFYSCFIATYWSGVSLAFGAAYLTVFYGSLAKWTLENCKIRREAPAVELSSLQGSRNQFFAPRPAMDEKEVPLMLAGYEADSEAKYSNASQYEEKNAEQHSSNKFKSGEIPRRQSYLWQQPSPIRRDSIDLELEKDVERFMKLHSSSSKSKSKSKMASPN